MTGLQSEGRESAARVAPSLLDSASREFQRVLDLPAWSLCLGTALFSLFFPSIAILPEIQWSPWLLSLLVFGLAHGGIDHQIAPILEGSSGGRKRPFLFILRYLASMLLILMIWAFNPVIGLFQFLLLSAFHFGQGDLYWSSRFGLCSIQGDEAGGGERIRRAYQLVFLVIRGAFPVLLPILIFHEQFSSIALQLMEQLGRAQRWDGDGMSQFRGLFLWGFGLLFGFQMALGLIIAVRHTSTQRSTALRATAIEIAETMLLGILFISTPFILAVGVYFLVWHSPRHVARLMLMTDPMRSQILRGNFRRALLSFHRRALPMTVAALGLLVVVWAAISRQLLSAADFIGPTFLFLSAITFPHLICVLSMDRVQRIWRGKNSPASQSGLSATFHGGRR